jgi:hypothetical protein
MSRLTHGGANNVCSRVGTDDDRYACDVVLPSYTRYQPIAVSRRSMLLPPPNLLLPLEHKQETVTDKGSEMTICETMDRKRKKHADVYFHGERSTTAG